MGNFFTRKQKVSPLQEGMKTSESRKSGNARWYLGALCCKKNAVTPYISATNLTAEPNIKAIEECKANAWRGKSDLQVEALCEADLDSSRELALIESRKFELSSVDAKLSKLECDEESTVVRKGIVLKRDEEGKTRAVAFDVELLEEDTLNRPQSSLSTGQRTNGPRRLRNRLPELPALTKEDIERKLSQAVSRRDTLMRDRSERIRERSALSNEMLQRLEAEKQRLLREKIQEKERKAAEKKERLSRRKERKAARRSRKTEQAKTNAVERERQSCANAEQALRTKMRVAEENKKKVMHAQELKLNEHRYKQIQAKLKTLEDNRKPTLESANEGTCNEGFKIPLHLLSKEKRQKARQTEEKVEKIEWSKEESSEDEMNFETYVDDSKHPFEDSSEGEESEEDPFWN